VSDQPGGLLATGLGYTEGPACLPDGSVLFTSMAGALYRIADGRLTTAAGDVGCGPTGLVGDVEGIVYVAACSGIHGSPGDVPGGIYRLAGESFEPFVTDGLGAPNDICFGPDGLLYFTDPGSDPRALRETPISGRVMSLSPDTGDLRVLDDTGFFPNGLAFDPSGEWLVVAETFSTRLVRYRLAAGQLTDKTVFVEGIPCDGMAFDAGGNLWQCVNPSDSIHVYDPRGRLIDRFETGEGSFPSNCCFGGPSLSTLYVTAAGAGGIAAFSPGVSGLPLYPFR
jgi:gluconolactonase